MPDPTSAVPSAVTDSDPAAAIDPAPAAAVDHAGGAPSRFRLAAPAVVVPVVVSILLAVLAFLADSVDGAPGRLMTALTSSGFAWGLAAFLTAFSAPTLRRAVITATALLTATTLLYYLLILLVSRRWSGGYLEDGSSADMFGLLSLAIMTAAWLVASLIAGPLFAVLGHAVRTAPRPRAALALGTASGLLLAQSVYEMAAVPPWRFPDIPFSDGVLLPDITLTVLPLAVLAILATLHRLWPSWPLLITSLAAASAIGATLWSIPNTIATLL
ncbi:DUF6518 family protein [Actinoplanes sp. NPDC051851]|uniref:DUF6518 family protein n=1 Tax=Actinoplanes sp. NPDC051851 TaxID=3154753 RepID=UPI003439DFE2